MPKRVVPEGEGKRVPVMSRTTKELRSKLEDAAAESGRSLGQEVEYRLDASFRRPPGVTEALGGEGPALLGRLIALTVQAVETTTGRSWREDAATRAKLYHTIRTMLVATLGDGVNALEDEASERAGQETGFAFIEFLRERGAPKFFPAFSLLGEPEESRRAKLDAFEREANTPGTFAYMASHPEAYPFPEHPEIGSNDEIA
jgi:hypothetical protein